MWRHGDRMPLESKKGCDAMMFVKLRIGKII